jgi:uncharacterized Rmd1/YagE family protein
MEVDNIAVKAYYVSKNVDIIRLLSSPYGAKPTTFQSKSLTISVDEGLRQYISVYKYGSVVFFNIPEDEHTDHLLQIQEVTASETIAENLRHTEEYQLKIDPTLQTSSRLKNSDLLLIKKLNSNHLEIVAAIMAQTVALDHYAVLVDKIVETFSKMNIKMGESGKFDELDRRKLFSLIASNNTVITSVVSKLGIFEGSDAAWDDGDTWDTWDSLRKDFELDHRFKDLSLKLEIVRDNTTFFLEILNHQKSTKLEWIIIVLISAEIMISLAPYIPKVLLME